VTAAKIREKLNELDSLPPFQINMPVRDTEQQPEPEKTQPVRKKGWFARLFRKRQGLIKSISLCI
ncbi:MAG: hypothetical protein ACI4A3_10620, partial [Lachnospiraceae bacterium]